MSNSPPDPEFPSFSKSPIQAETGGSPIPRGYGSNDLHDFARAKVLAEILEEVLTRLANRGYTPWHTAIDSIAHKAGAIRRDLEGL